MPVRQTTAAALVPPRLPKGVNHGPSIAEDAGLLVDFRGPRGKSEGLDVTIGQAHSQQWLCRVQGRGEDIRVERKSTEVFEHGGQSRDP
jgi:hypothetical protein